MFVSLKEAIFHILLNIVVAFCFFCCCVKNEILFIINIIRDYKNDTNLMNEAYKILLLVQSSMKNEFDSVTKIGGLEASPLSLGQIKVMQKIFSEEWSPSKFSVTVFNANFMSYKQEVKLICTKRKCVLRCNDSQEIRIKKNNKLYLDQQMLKKLYIKSRNEILTFCLKKRFAEHRICENPEHNFPSIWDAYIYTSNVLLLAISIIYDDENNWTNQVINSDSGFDSQRFNSSYKQTFKLFLTSQINLLGKEFKKTIELLNILLEKKEILSSIDTSVFS